MLSYKFLHQDWQEREYNFIRTMRAIDFYVVYAESVAVSYKMRFNSDAELIDFEELIILKLINNVVES